MFECIRKGHHHHLEPNIDYTTEEVNALLKFVKTLKNAVGQIDQLTNFAARLTADEETIDKKVDKVTGKALSSNDYTTADKSKLSDLYTKAQLDEKFGGKVDKATGKSLIDSDVANIMTHYSTQQEDGIDIAESISVEGNITTDGEVYSKGDIYSEGDIHAESDISSEGDIKDSAGNVLANKVDKVTGKSLIETNFAEDIHWDASAATYQHILKNSLEIQGQLKVWDTDDEEHEVGDELVELSTSVDNLELSINSKTAANLALINAIKQKDVSIAWSYSVNRHFIPSDPSDPEAQNDSYMIDDTKTITIKQGDVISLDEEGEGFEGDCLIIVNASTGEQVGTAQYGGDPYTHTGASVKVYIGSDWYYTQESGTCSLTRKLKIEDLYESLLSKSIENKQV